MSNMGKQHLKIQIFPISCVLNVMIVLDRSDSVLGGFNSSREFILDVSSELNIGPEAHSVSQSVFLPDGVYFHYILKVSMVVYSGSNYRQDVYKWNFAKNNEEFTRIVKDLRPIGGTTNTKKALETALELMESRNKTIPTVIMVWKIIVIKLNYI